MVPDFKIEQPPANPRHKPAPASHPIRTSGRSAG